MGNAVATELKRVAVNAGVTAPEIDRRTGEELIIQRGGHLTAKDLDERKEFALRDDVGHVDVQPVKATLQVKHRTDGTLKSSGYRLEFPDSPEAKNTYISTGEARKAGCLTVIGADAEGNEVYDWSASQLGIQPSNVQGEPAQWVIA